MNTVEPNRAAQGRSHTMRGGMTSLALSLALACSVAPQIVMAQGSPVQINIQTQPLGAALLELGAQTSLQIFFSQDVVADKTAQAISGTYAPEIALEQLLQGTDIHYARDGNNITLSLTAIAQLDAVTVSGGILGDLSPAYAGGQVATGGSLGLLGAENVMDTPFSVTNYTAELLFDQQARTLADVVVNDASVRAITSTGGFGEDFMIRGFTVSSNYGLSDVSVNGLYGLVAPSRLPVQIMERVEVMKGPGTLMRGINMNGSVGGSVNIVTKRADDEPLNRVTLGYMTQSNLTSQVDFGRRFGEDNAWGVRLNVLKRGGEATTHDGDQGLGMAALGVDYRGQKLRWSMDLINQEDELENVRSQIGFQTGLDELPAPPDGRINFYPGTRLTQRDSTIMSRLEYDFTDRITGHVAAGYREGKNRQIFPLTQAFYGGQAMDAEGNYRVVNSFYDTDSKTFSGDAGLSFRFDTDPVNHRLALGVTYTNQEQGTAFSAGSAVGSSNIYDTVHLPAEPSVRNDPVKSSGTKLTSYAIADTMSFLDDRVLLMLGARHQTVAVDSFDTTTGALASAYKASAVSPLAGVVVKPLENVSLYANFTEGLTRGTIVGASYVNKGEILDPYKSKQYEAGVKVDWGRVTTTAAIWQIARPSGQADADNIYGYFGEQRNRGLELNAYGELRPGLRLMAGASFIDGQLTGTPGGINDGNRAPGVPRSAFNLGLDWDTPWVDGLSVNGRVLYTSSTYLDNANQYRLPAVTRFDIGARYLTRIADKEVALRVNVDNLTDQRYWLASGTYLTNAAGRTVMVSASVDF